MNAPKIRPILIWVIAILCFLMALSGSCNNAVFLSGVLPLSPIQQEYLDSWTLFDKVAPFVGAIVLFAAGVALLMRRKSAVWLFGVYFLIAVTISLVHAATSSWLTNNGSTGLLATGASWLMFGVCWWYAAHLKRKGALSE